MEMEIKKISCKDYDDFIKLLQFRYRLYIRELSYIRAKYEYEILKMEFDEFDEFSTFLVAEEDKNIIGCARIIEDKGHGLPVYLKTDILTDSMFGGCQNIELGRFMVDSTRKNSGLFALLFNEASSQMFKMDCDYIFADTFKDSASFRMLKRLGFRESGKEYFDEYFNLPKVSTLLFIKKDDMERAFQTRPNRSQKAIQEYYVKRTS